MLKLFELINLNDLRQSVSSNGSSWTNSSGFTVSHLSDNTGCFWNSDLPEVLHSQSQLWMFAVFYRIASFIYHHNISFCCCDSGWGCWSEMLQQGHTSWTRTQRQVSVKSFIAFRLRFHCFEQ